MVEKVAEKAQVASRGRERTLAVHGRAVQLWEGGEGRPLVYLHGAGTFWWLPIHDLLARRHRVYLPVHPGFGATEGIEEMESIEDVVFHTLDVLDALGLESPDVVGLSFGGWVAAELALRHPLRVGRLVLVDAAGTRVPGVPKGEFFMAGPAKARELIFHEATSPLAMSLIPDVAPPERLEVILRGREAAARYLWNPHVQYRKLTSRLWRIKAPTLVVWGEGDRLIPLPYGEAYARGIPGARLVTIARCGHVPPVERPAEFTEIVESFLT